MNSFLLVFLLLGGAVRLKKKLSVSAGSAEPSELSKPVSRRAAREDDDLRAEIRALREETSLLRQHLETQRAADEARDAAIAQQLAVLGSFSSSLKAEPNKPTRTLSVFVGSTGLPKKPFFFKAEGLFTCGERLSAIRTAILSVLLLDLRDREERGSGFTDPIEAITRTYEAIEPGGQSEDIANIVRVGIYRFAEFCKERKLFRSPHYSLNFNVSEMRLIFAGPNGAPMDTPLSVQLKTDDNRIAHIFDEKAIVSPLNRLRQRHALYLSSGAGGSDDFLLEMYDHPFPLKVTSLYVRPPFQSYPIDLLQHIGVSESTLHRKRVAFEGYRSGRFQFFEILPRQTIWDLIRLTHTGDFKFYPSSVKIEQVCDHLDNLIYILKEYEHYHFYLTDASIPFALVLYEIKSKVPAECFTVFFQAFQSARTRDLGCFVLNDPDVYRNIQEHIVRWILAHPSTVNDRQSVVEFIAEVREHLVTHGPISADEIR